MSGKPNTPYDEIESIFKLHLSELELMKAELSSFVSKQDLARQWKLKALLLLAYGHFEGTVKEIADKSIEYIQRNISYSNELTPHLFLKVNHGRILDMAQAISVKKKYKLIIDINTSPKKLPLDCIKYVETRSNLNSENYEEICSLFGFYPYEDGAQSSVLSDFVDQTRHPIAHSGFLRSKSDISIMDVISQLEVVIKLLKYFKIQVLESLKKRNYLHSSKINFLNLE